MRLRIPCMACFRADGRPSDEAVSVEIRDDGLYVASCSRGHVTLTAIQAQKFEILFDSGAMALLDGYPREAVASMAAALERFYEYCVLVICLKHGVAHEAFVNAWAAVTRQSERQLGAFLFLYLLQNKKPLDRSIVDARPAATADARNRRSWTEFRNHIIHQGYIPSSEEVLGYGDLVYQFIYRLIGELRTTCSESMEQATFLHLKRGLEAAEGAQVTTMAIPTLISLSRADGPASSLLEALKDLRDYKRWLYHHPQPQ